MAFAPIKDMRNPGRTIHVGVILMGGTTEMIDVAPIELLTGMTNQWVGDVPENVVPSALKSQTVDIKFHWVNEHGTLADLSAGLMVQATDSFESCPPLDVALMGAHNMGYTPNAAELSFIRKTFDNVHSFLCICGGMMPPLMAGCLEGLHATCPRPFVEPMKAQSPTVHWSDRRWQRDGKLWTSSTLLNGTDMMRVWAAETFGGQDTLMENILKVGGWPVRDVDFKDEDAEGYNIADGVEAAAQVQVQG